MIEYIEGRIAEKNPAYVVVDCGGVGYFINISLHTYTQLKDMVQGKVYTHQVIREDMHQLFGFAEADERRVFRHLISVSGVGANTARMILSSLSPVDVQKAIATNNVQALQSVKGIGGKSAQRIIVDLKDKIGKSEFTGTDSTGSVFDNSRDEAVKALGMLGFAKTASEKLVDKIINSNSEKISVEELVKQALKNL